MSKEKENKIIESLANAYDKSLITGPDTSHWDLDTNVVDGKVLYSNSDRMYINNILKFY